MCVCLCVWFKRGVPTGRRVACILVLWTLRYYDEEYHTQMLLHANVGESFLRNVAYVKHTYRYDRAQHTHNNTCAHSKGRRFCKPSASKLQSATHTHSLSHTHTHTYTHRHTRTHTHTHTRKHSTRAPDGCRTLISGWSCARCCAATPSQAQTHITMESYELVITHTHTYTHAPGSWGNTPAGGQG